MINRSQQLLDDGITDISGQMPPQPDTVAFPDNWILENLIGPFTDQELVKTGNCREPAIDRGGLQALLALRLHKSIKLFASDRLGRLMIDKLAEDG
jgi:hypothetical protein